MPGLEMTDSPRNDGDSEGLRMKIEAVRNLKDETCKEMEALIEEMKEDTAAFLKSGTCDGESLQAFNERMTSLRGYLKDKRSEVQNLHAKLSSSGQCSVQSSQDKIRDSESEAYPEVPRSQLHYHIQALQNYVTTLQENNSPHMTGDNIASLREMIQKLSQTQEESEKKIFIWMKTLRQMAERKYEAVLAANVALTNKSEDLEKCFKTDVDILTNELSNLKLELTEVSSKSDKPPQLDQHGHSRQDETSKHEIGHLDDPDMTILKSRQHLDSNERAESQILREEIKYLKAEMSSFREQISRNKMEMIQSFSSCEEQHKSMRGSLNKVREEISQIDSSGYDSGYGGSQKLEQIMEEKLLHQEEETNSQLKKMRKKMEAKIAKLDNSLKKLNDKLEDHQETSDKSMDLKSDELEKKIMTSVKENTEKLALLDHDVENSFKTSETCKAKVDEFEKTKEDWSDLISSYTETISDLKSSYKTQQKLFDSLSLSDGDILSKDDVVAIVKGVGEKYEMMKAMILEKMKHLEILRRNLTLANQRVESRTELSDKMAVLEKKIDNMEARDSHGGYFSVGTRSTPLPWSDGPKFGSIFGTSEATTVAKQSYDSTSPSYSSASPSCGPTSLVYLEHVNSTISPGLSFQPSAANKTALGSKSALSLSKPTTVSGGTSFGTPKPTTFGSGATFGPSKSTTVGSKSALSLSKPTTVGGGTSFGTSKPTTFGSGATFGTSKSTTVANALPAQPSPVHLSSFVKKPSTTATANPSSTSFTNSSTTAQGFTKSVSSPPTSTISRLPTSNSTVSSTGSPGTVLVGASFSGFGKNKVVQGKKAFTLKRPEAVGFSFPSFSFESAMDMTEPGSGSNQLGHQVQLAYNRFDASGFRYQPGQVGNESGTTPFKAKPLLRPSRLGEIFQASTVKNVIWRGTPLQFNPVVGTDTLMENKTPKQVVTWHQCITAMPQYQHKSLEELRFEDKSYYPTRQKQNSESLPGMFLSYGQMLKVISPEDLHFVAPSGQDTMMKSGVTTSINTLHQCITAMKEYEDKSLEELRYFHYCKMVKFCDSL